MRKSISHLRSRLLAVVAVLFSGLLGLSYLVVPVNAAASATIRVTLTNTSISHTVLSSAKLKLFQIPVSKRFFATS